VSPYTTQAAQSAYAKRRYWSDPVAQVKHREVTRATKGAQARQLYLPVGIEDYVPTLETMIERIPADKRTGKWLEQWKHLRRDGWTVTVLVAPDHKSIVGLACRWGERWRWA
jgi:hypothetical protein